MSATVKKLQFAEGTSVAAPTDLDVNSLSVSLGTYVDDAAYVVANGTAVEGSIYVNTTTDLIRYYDGSGWLNVQNVINASASLAGIVSTGTQTFAGSKTIYNCFPTATASPSSTRTVTNADESTQYLTPSADMSVKLDSSHIQGRVITVVNLSTTKIIIIIANDNAVIRTVYPNTVGQVHSSQTTPTTNTHWFGVGTVASNWAAEVGLTVAGAGTISGMTAYSRRLGDTYEVHGSFVSGTAAGTQFSFSTPGSGIFSGIAIDTAKIGNFSFTGEMQAATSGGSTTTILNQGPLGSDGSDTAKIFSYELMASGSFNKANGNQTLSNTTQTSFKFYYPVSGWTTTKG